MMVSTESSLRDLNFSRKEKVIDLPLPPTSPAEPLERQFYMN